MGETTGFLKWDRETPHAAAGAGAPARLERGLRGRSRPRRSQTQAGRCMDCGIPFCNNGCPLGNLIPDWNDLVYRDHWRDAIERLHATNNFPEFTGRLCPAPCEAACVLGINQDPVTIKQVEVEIIDRAWDEGWVAPQSPPVRTGKRVAVVGSGPAGLAAAQQLTRAGHDVVVFERADRIGGLLRYGIPEFKMEKRHLDRRLEQMEAEGTEFRTNADVGVDVDVEVLLRRRTTPSCSPAAPPRGATCRSRAASSAASTRRWSTCRRPTGCRRATSTTSPIDADGKHVVIIGGGDTGADCLGTAHRQGAASVTPVRDPAPAARQPRRRPTRGRSARMIFRVTSAHEEGGERVYGVNTERFLDDGNGRVRALRLHEVEMVDGRVREGRGHRPRAPGRPRAPRHGLRRARRRARGSTSSASSSTTAATSPATTDFMTERARRVRGRRHGPRPEPHRVGDRRGPRVRRRRRPLPDGRDPPAVAGRRPPTGRWSEPALRADDTGRPERVRCSTCNRHVQRPECADSACSSVPR